MSASAQNIKTKNTRVEKHRYVETNRSLAARLLFGTWNLFKLLIIAWLFGVCIEWIGLTFFWSDEGVNHSERMLSTELNYLNVGFKEWVVGISPVEIAMLFASVLKYLVFDFTHINDLVNWTASAPADASYARITAMNLVVFLIDYFQAAVNATQLFAVRLAVLVLSSPIFIIVGVAALIDGLVERELRKAGGGNESAFVYHNVKPWVRPALIGSWLLYLALPFSLHPNFIFVPGAIFFGLTVYITAAWFKKYI